MIRLPMTVAMLAWPFLASLKMAPLPGQRAEAIASMTAFQTLDLAAGINATALSPAAIALLLAAVPFSFWSMIRLRFWLRRHLR